MTEQTPIFQKQLRFFKLNPPKRQTDQKTKVKPIQFINQEYRKFHEIIREVLKDYQFFSNYQKFEMNLTEGERVLRMNGIKIIKENTTFFIQKYFTRQENVLKKSQTLTLKPSDRSETLRLLYSKNQTLTDPKYLLSSLGYSTKQKDYYQYFELQCYKCPAYGIQIVIYQRWDDFHYILVDSVLNYEGINPLSNLLIDKLAEFLIEEPFYNIDPYTLRPKNLKHGIRMEV